MPGCGSPRGLAALAAAALVAAGMAGGAPAGAGEWPELLDGHGGPVRGVALSAERPEALSGSFDYTVIHWRLDNGEEPIIVNRLVGHDAAVNAVAFVPGGRLAVSASDDGTVGLWDLDEARLVERFEAGANKIVDVDVTADGRLAASAGWDHMARLFDLEARVSGPVLAGHEGHVNAVAFSPDGGRLYSGAQDGTIRMWDTATGEMVRVVHRHGWSVNAVQVVPGGDQLLFGAVDGSAWVLDIETGDVLRELGHHDGPVLAAAIHPEEGAAAVAGADGHLRVYRVSDWTMHHDHSNPYGPIWAIAFTNDGRMIYHGGLDDYVIGLQIDPPPDFEAAVGEFPRRFKPIEEMELGEAQFARRCSVCHTLTPDDANRAGPTLYRLFGREAGTLPGYPYSDALLESDIVWSEETVAELFDKGPDVVTPGTKMPIQRIRDEEELIALVGFLKEATAGQEEAAD